MAFLAPRTSQVMSPFFHRFPASDLATFFRLLDDDTDLTPHTRNTPTFSPRFDVREEKDAYMVHGELPGIEQKDINIEFTDVNTLTISGRTEHEYSKGDLPEESKGKGRKATVEDEQEASANTDTQVATTTSEQGKQVGHHHPTYIIRERSVGEFRRSFTFPGKINQDTVKASLKNGILSVTIPKATFAKKTINVE
jgi:HSP20 family molecular chaperone IbpA